MDDGLGMEHPIYECVTPLRYRNLKKKNSRGVGVRLGLEHPSSSIFVVLMDCEFLNPFLHRVCLLMLERKRSWNIVETLETHREERQMEENSLHNQHNIVNFLLEVNTAIIICHPTLFTIPASQTERYPAQSNSSRCHQVIIHSQFFLLHTLSPFPSCHQGQ